MYRLQEGEWDHEASSVLHVQDQRGDRGSRQVAVYQQDGPVLKGTIRSESGKTTYLRQHLCTTKAYLYSSGGEECTCLAPGAHGRSCAGLGKFHSGLYGRRTYLK